MLTSLIFKDIAAWFHELSLAQLTNYYIFLLVGLFLFFLVWCLTPIILRWVQLRWTIASIYYKRKWHRKADSSQELLQKNIFKNTAWARRDFENFRLAWEEARLPGKDVAVCPIRMREFLSPEKVIDGAVNQRLAEALPGIFVALGIFGTFLGLVLGLKELNFDELANLREGIGQLISGLSLAFYTSLVGISFSVLFSLLYRWLLRRIENAVDSLDEAMVSIFPYEPDELFIRKNYEMQGDIKQSIQTMATDIATKFSETIAPALDEALTKNLLPGMVDLQKDIKESLKKSEEQQEIFLRKIGTVIVNHFEDSQKKQSDAMEEVLSAYVNRMNKTFQTQFQDMGRIIEETTRVQGEIRDQMVQFTERLHKQFGVQSELIDRTADAARILNDSLQSLEGIARELKSSAEDITNAAILLKESANKSMEGQDVLKETMDRQVSAMTKTRTELEETWGGITKNANELMEMMRELIRELAEGVGEQLTKALNIFDSKVAEVVDRFGGTLFEIRENIEDFPELLLKLEQNIEQVNETVLSQKNIVEGLENTSRNLIAPNVETAFSAAKELQTTSESLGSLLSENGPLYSALSEFIQKISAHGQFVPDPSDSGDADMYSGTQLQLKSINDNLQQLNQNNQTIQEVIQKEIHELTEQTNEILTGINGELLNKLKAISDSTALMSQNVESIETDDRMPESKNGFFKKMIRK